MHADPVSINQITTFPSRVDEQDHDDGRKYKPPGSRTLFDAVLVSDPETDQCQDHGSHIADHVIPGVSEIHTAALPRKSVKPATAASAAMTMAAPSDQKAASAQNGLAVCQ